MRAARRWMIPLAAAVAALVTGVAAAAGVAAGPTVGPAPTPVLAPATAVGVQGAHLLRNGLPWVPRGVQIVGLVAPDGALSGKYVGAHEHFGTAELEAAVADHADLVRIQVSEFAIDPDGPLYSAAYVQEVVDGVQAARRLGLAVIVSVQAEPPAGEPTRCPLPDGGTARAWAELASLFAGDPGVMFELYNEPAVAPTATDWALWRDGGEVLYPAGSCQAVGMQTLIDQIRTTAPDNVIVVPGLAGEQTLAGMPRLSDPAHPGDPQLAYGIHYPALTKPTTAWDRAFGTTSGRVPVLVTEWDANATTNCLPDAPAQSARLLDYLASKRIGIVGFAFDLPGTIVADWSGTPTSYAGFACGAPDGGPGQLLFGDFAAEAAAGDGTRPDPDRAWLVDAATATTLVREAPGAATALLNTPRTYVTGADATTLAGLGLSTAIPAERFANETALAAAVRGGRLRSGTGAVVYAPTDGAATPPAQRRDLTRYAALAAAAAHAGGVLLIVAPGLDLVRALAPRSPASRAPATFLRLGIAGGLARDADAEVLPAQSLESRSRAFAAFTASAAAQAARARPGIELLAGLSSGASSAAATASTLFDAYLGSPASVSGDALTAGPGLGATRVLAFLRTLTRFDQALTAKAVASAPATANRGAGGHAG